MDTAARILADLSSGAAAAAMAAAVLAVAALIVLIWLAYRHRNALPASGEMLDCLLQAATDGVLIIDRKGIVRRTNPAAARILQRTSIQLLDVPVADLLGRAFEREELKRWAADKNAVGPRNIRLLYDLPPPGGQRRIQLAWHMLRERGRVVAHLCLLREARALARASGHAPAKSEQRDSLTDLPGRSQFLRRLERAVMQMYEQAGEFECTVMLLNLDRFKKVNDHLGPSLADEALGKVAQRLQDAVADHYLARLEGDQFGILVSGRTQQEELAKLLEAVKAAVERPFSVQVHELRLTASMGVVAKATDYRYAADLLRDARIALAYAKNRGLGQYQVFDQTMRAYALKHARIEVDLRKALDNGELRAVYQPIVDVGRKRVVGFETLVRWRHPVHGEISPGDFIDIAEDSERITPIGRHIRETSCKRLVEWQRIAGDPELYLSFNLTDQEVRRPELASELRGYLGNTGLSPSSLRIELVERMLLEDDSRAALERLVELGLPLYIDDFGTGYSSFSRLYDAPVHTLKIDRSFVQQMTRSEQGMKVVSAIAGLGHSLGVNLIAEGVEGIDELTRLEALGCTYIQGYLFSAALEADAVPDLLRNQEWVDGRLQLATDAV